MQYQKKIKLLEKNGYILRVKNKRPEIYIRRKGYEKLKEERIQYLDKMINDENNKEQTLTLDTDYVVDEYRNNINAANAGGANAPYAAIHGVASCTGTATVEFNILKKNVEDLVYSKIEDPQYVPLKTKYEPELNVYMTSTSAEPLVRNVDYVADYFNNEAVKDANGTSGPFVQITPKDTTNYTGSKTIPFSICLLYTSLSPRD